MKPPLLVRGALVRLTAPSSPPKGREQVDVAMKLIRDLRLVPECADLDRLSEEQRLDDFVSALTDEKVEAVFVLRGGECGNSLFLRHDLRKLRIGPKIIMGFSDFTNALCALYRNPNVVAIHGPMFSGREFFPEALMRQLEQLLYAEAGPRAELFDGNYKVLRDAGPSRGVSLAANAFVLNNLIGTAYEPDWSETFLFIESVGLPRQVVTSIFVHLKMIGALDRLRGLVVGNLGIDKADKELAIDSVLELLPDTLPIFETEAFGHVTPNFPILCGCLMNWAEGKLGLIAG